MKGDALCWLGEKRAGGSETKQAQMISDDSQSKNNSCAALIIWERKPWIGVR